MPRLKISWYCFFPNVDFRVIIATGLPVGRQRPPCVLQPIQVQSPLKPKQGIQQEGRFALDAPGVIERSPASQRPETRPEPGLSGQALIT